MLRVENVKAKQFPVKYQAFETLSLRLCGRKLNFLAGNQDHICVLDRVACPNQTNCAGHTFLELDMRLVLGWNAGQTFGESVTSGLVVMFQEFPRHVSLGGVKISPNGRKHLQDSRHIVANRKVQRFDLRPKRESTVGYYQGVGMPNPSQERKQVGVEDF